MFELLLQLLLVFYRTIYITLCSCSCLSDPPLKHADEHPQLHVHSHSPNFTQKPGLVWLMLHFQCFRLLLMFIFITIISPYFRSRGSGPGLKRVGGGSNLAMSSLSLPPGCAKTSDDVKLSIMTFDHIDDMLISTILIQR